MTSEAPARRTGGRSAAVRTSIAAAVRELIAERGAERMSVPMVAERAGVNPTSIYRRWGDLAGLINDVATYRLDPDRPLPVTGDLRGDLTAWADELIEHYGHPGHAALLRGGAASAGEQESDCLRNRRAEAVGLLDRHPDAAVTVDQVLDHVAAPIIYRTIYRPWTLSPELGAELVSFLLAAS